MASQAVLQGYLLEEALAWMLRNTGYRLLQHKDDDPAELRMPGERLLVRGRGADHQVDVLGEFSLTPAFSLPVRMFLEAKFQDARCGLSVVRNAHGVISDVNENYVRTEGSRPRRRFQYVYALFSTSGFTAPAQEYAIAQQISLVDLSGESYQWLKNMIIDAAADMYTLQTRHRLRLFPVNWMRRTIRALLAGYDTEAPATALSPSTILDEETITPPFRIAAIEPLGAFTRNLYNYQQAELLLGFPAAPLTLVLGTHDPARFISYADNHPSHRVRLRRTDSGPGAEWVLTPWDEPDSYELRFNLPDRIESWIRQKEEYRRKRTSRIKTDFLSAITVYRQVVGETRIYQLRYEPSELHRP